MTAAAMTAGVTVEELKRAWAAVQDGQFRDSTRSGAPRTPARPPTGEAGSISWTPETGERVLPVLGCSGSCGATTVALALAEAAARAYPPGRATRVVECRSGSSGLAAAGTSELGTDASGWSRASRSGLTLHRMADTVPGPTAVPPPPTDGPYASTVVDLGWDLNQLLASPNWMCDQVTPAPPSGPAPAVVVAVATIPGLRGLEGVLALLPDNCTVAAVRGLRRSRAFSQTAGTVTRRLAAEGRLIAWPQVPRLAVAGIDARPLPAAVRHAAATLLTLAGHHPTFAGARR